MSITGRRGIVFSFDLLIAFIVMCLILCLILVNMNLRADSAVSAQRSFALQHAALSVADTLVQNADLNNPALGSAYFGEDKRRVFGNVIDGTLLAKADFAGISLGKGIFLKEVSLRYKSGEYGQIHRSPLPAGSCTAAERFVVVKGAAIAKGATEEKAILTVVACEGGI
ncbi:MAG: hypothetical protein V1676_01730 [Candidatus Diapherotrites archaeon]